MLKLPKNKITSEIGQLTPELLIDKRWQKVNDLRLIVISKVVTCPKTGNIIRESDCVQCEYNYGMASKRAFYCGWDLGPPRGKSKKSIRNQKKKEE